MKILILLTLLFFAPVGFYTLQVQTLSGGTQSFSDYTGKKVLIVNIATGSSLIGQVAALKTLQQQYGDKVQVVAFPSNSFGKEARSNTQIAAFLDSAYAPNFPVAQKGDVTGSSQTPVYQWLTSSARNGDVSTQVLGDFQKYLIDTSGRIEGIFAGRVSPLDSVIIRAINQ